MESLNGTLFDPLRSLHQVKIDNVFKLSDLPFHLLERIITKLEEKSYFLMQQTSKLIYEFIRTSRNIQAIMDNDKQLCWTSNDDGRFKLCRVMLYTCMNYSCVPMDLESLYGVRWKAAVSVPRNSGNFFKEFCDLIRKYRITAQKLDISGWNPCIWEYEAVEYSREEFSTLYEILKPIKVILPMKGASHYDLCLNIKYMRRIEICIGPDDAIEVMKKVVATIPKPVLFAPTKWTAEQLFPFLISFLQILCHNTPTTLLSARFIGDIEDTISFSSTDALKELQDFRPTFTENNTGDILKFPVETDNCTCELIVEFSHYDLRFKRSTK